MVCAACVIVLGLAEQINVQIKLGDSLKAKCEDSEDGSKASVQLCKKGVDEMILALTAKAVPEDVCVDIGGCQAQCKTDQYQDPFPVNLFVEWPVSPLPPTPIDWPVERRLTGGHMSLVGSAFRKLVVDMKTKMNKDAAEEAMPPLARVMMAVGHMLGQASGLPDASLGVVSGDAACGTNVTCHIVKLVDYHAPVADTDGDYYATDEHKELRGSHWRGTDCNDVLPDVYPGRKETDHPHSVDHNCNGISGQDAKGSYEEQFCEGSGQRGLVMLGDSATAHFHLPPQWMTANGWNLDGFKEDVGDEFDFPQCSWGTGHVTPEECPYQDDVPGANPRPGVQSLYTMMRERNRCNHNDFQNIGVNGARMSSSMGLVESMAREATLDHPVLLWLTMLGNDVCNGHRGFAHMSTPESFYTNAMASYNRLDELLPPGSYVIATDLFDGELLYDTMHAAQHPIGTTYDGFYDFMNCLEINPCWGWLNSDEVVRKNTTAIAHSLNAQYVTIEAEQDFKNFKLIHFSPPWVEMFQAYAASGVGPTTNLIEKGDGFHPSQAANNIFATTFFEWLEKEHPEALGPVNPHNADIDAMFFADR
jgi:hypothetical protein